MRLLHLAWLTLASCAVAPPSSEEGASSEALALSIDGGGVVWAEPGDVPLSGRADGATSVDVQGVARPVEGDAWTGIARVDAGMTSVPVVATAADGRTASTAAVVLAGRFSSLSEPLEGGLGLRITADGLADVLRLSTGLAALPTVLEGLVTPGTPVVTGSALGIGYEVVLTDLTLGETSLAVGLGDDALTLLVQVDGIVADVQVVATLFGADIPFDATLRATRLSVTTPVAVSAAGGQVRFTPGTVTVQGEGFALETLGLPSSLVGAIPFVTAALEDAVESEVRDAAQTQAPDLARAVAEAFDLSLTPDVLGAPLRLDARVMAVDVNPEAVTIDVDLDVAGFAEVEGLRYAGVYDLPTAPPSYASEAPLALSVHDDVLHRILFEAWRAGLLREEIALGADPAFDGLLDGLGVTEGTLSVRAALPPILDTATGDFILVLGAVDVVLSAPGSALGETTAVRLFARTPLTPRLAQGAFRFDLGTPTVQIEVLETTSGASREAVAALLEAKLPVAALLAAVTELEAPLPAFGGLTIDDATLAREGSGVRTEAALVLGVAP